MNVECIISGGQTGADRGGLDAALAMGIAHGGWCPFGRVAEDGAIPPHYQLLETMSAGYLPRTRRNVQDGDATIIFVERMSRGSQATVECCKELRKPFIIIPRTVNHKPLALARAIVWLRRMTPRVLNVAGNRESKAPGIQTAVTEILVAALKGPDA